MYVCVCFRVDTHIFTYSVNLVLNEVKSNGYKVSLGSRFCCLCSIPVKELKGPRSSEATDSYRTGKRNAQDS